MRCAALRIGWLGDLGGHLPMEPGIADACAKRALARCERPAREVEPLRRSGFDLRPCVAGLAGVAARAGGAARRGGAARCPARASRSSPTRCGNTTARRRLGFTEFMRASETRTALPCARCCRCCERFDALALPAAQVWPFDVRKRWPREIAGRAMDTYHRWMEVTLYATFAGLPAISVPAGFDAQDRCPWGCS